MTTVVKQVKFTGVGIHSGLPVTMVVKPSKRNGIFFRRVDIDKSKLIVARFDNVGETKMRNTTVGDVNGAHVKTIEHLMAALFLAGIDSAIIDIDGAETPILDGSANVFLTKLINATGNKTKMRKIVVKRPVVAYAHEISRMQPFWSRLKWKIINMIQHRKSDGFVKLVPNEKEELHIRATLVYPEQIIGTQTYEYTYNGTQKSVRAFLRDVARARTFGKYAEWEYLKAHGMGRGANENNVIALNNSGNGTLNKTLWPDEFVRHKIIDAIGDMATAGGWVVADMESYKGSHALNNLVLRKLFDSPDNFAIVETEKRKEK